MPRAAPVTIAIRCGITFAFPSSARRAVAERRCSCDIFPDGPAGGTAARDKGRVRCQVAEYRSGVGSAVSSVAFRGVRRTGGALAVVAGALLAVAGCSPSPSSPSSSSAAVPAPSRYRGVARLRRRPGPQGRLSAGTATAPAPAGASSGALPSASMTPLAAAAASSPVPPSCVGAAARTDFPAGFATPSTGTITSAGSLTSGPATYDLATVSCATFIQHFGTTGFGETAMVSGSVAAAGQAYDQLVYQFGTRVGRVRVRRGGAVPGRPVRVVHTPRRTARRALSRCGRRQRPGRRPPGG